MKKLIPISLLFTPLIVLFSFIFSNKAENGANLITTTTTTKERIAYEDLINNHEFRKRKYTNSQLSEIPKKDRPDLAWEQNYLATMNPVTGRPEREKLMDVRRIIKQQQEELLRNPGDGANPWVERGPDNVGGRTRALAWDPSSANKVWAGGVTGGLWYNNNITDANSSWQSVNDFWDNIAVTVVKFDPNDANTIYVGTGEGWGASSSRGEGVWKSTNGGTSFTQLASTNSWRYVNDLVIRDEAGNSVVYVAISAQFYQGAWAGGDGLMRSTNGGTTWNQVLPNAAGGGTEHPTDLDIAADNDLWVGVGVNSFGNGGGSIYVSSDGTTFTLKHTNGSPGRVNLACAPSNANYVYAAFEVGNQMNAFKQTTDDGTTWATKSEPNDDDGGIPATDFTRGQAWYDLTLDVDPLNANTVLMGGIDVFKTTNGGTGWTQLTHWYGGFGHQYLHADQQATVYKDGSSNDVVFGNDGGVGYSGNGGTTIGTRNKGYNVTQYYACAIHPSVGSNNFLAGAQDNGTQRYTSAGMNSTTEATGGDGAYCHIDQTNGNYQTTSYINNVIYHSSNGGTSFSEILSDDGTGLFINPSDLDNNQNILYTYQSPTSLYRITNFESGAPTIGTRSIANIGAAASALSVSPYTTGSTTLFIGTSAGRLFKLANANAAPTQTEITGGAFPAGSISCVAFGANENEILVTFSNYGVNSIWYTSNGGGSWVSKEGNLPDMPVRWALFNPINAAEVILATELGVWATTNLTAGSPAWTTSNSGLANVRVDMLQVRTADNEAIAATHGRGLFSSDGFGPAALLAGFVADETAPSTIETVSFTDNSNPNPTSWTWTFSPATVTYQNGTNANSQHPQVVFDNAGAYTVTLAVVLGAESDTEVKNNYINVVAPSYCTAASLDAGFEYIDRVSFNTINNNNNGTSVYSDYTGQSTDVARGAAHDFTINFTQNYASDQVIVWIDFNQDYEFKAADGEEFAVVSGGGGNGGTNHTLSINIPVGATLGATRMRVRLHDTGNGPNATPCGDSSYGEVEDYTVNITAVLPIELIDFEAKAIEVKAIQLDWKTATETNNTGFELQRSTDGSRFENIAWIDGKGTTAEPQQYHYLDKSIKVNQIYYYRLKQIDHDDVFSYSKIRSAITKGVGAQIKVYPNPTSDWLYIAKGARNSLLNGTTLELFDALGRKVLTQSLDAQGISIDIRHLSKGVYFYKIRSAQEALQSGKIVLETI